MIYYCGFFYCCRLGGTDCWARVLLRCWILLVACVVFSLWSKSKIAFLPSPRGRPGRSLVGELWGQGYIKYMRPRVFHLLVSVTVHMQYDNTESHRFPCSTTSKIDRGVKYYSIPCELRHPIILITLQYKTNTLVTSTTVCITVNPIRPLSVSFCTGTFFPVITNISIITLLQFTLLCIP